MVALAQRGRIANPLKQTANAYKQNACKQTGHLTVRPGALLFQASSS